MIEAESWFRLRISIRQTNGNQRRSAAHSSVPSTRNADFVVNIRSADRR